MNTLTLKIPDIIKEKLKTYARRKGISRSEIVRKALNEYFEKDDFKDEGSFYDLAKDLAGSVKERSDLSTNKKHLRRIWSMRPKRVIIDTGPIVAFLNKSDKYHEWAIIQFSQLIPPFFTCESVISEACFLLRHTENGPSICI